MLMKRSLKKSQTDPVATAPRFSAQYHMEYFTQRQNRGAVATGSVVRKSQHVVNEVSFQYCQRFNFCRFAGAS